MFHTSSQRNHWIFVSEEELTRIRTKGHEKAIEAAQNVRSLDKEHISQPITKDESEAIVGHYCLKLREFGRKFKPPMPMNVIGTAILYLKRYYLRNSVLEHPVSSIAHLCVFIACKAEEWNSGSRDQFAIILNKGATEDATDFFRKFESHVLDELKFHIVVHLPLRPLKGFLADMRSRLSDECDELTSEVENSCNKIILDWMATDVMLLHPPSQIALAALHKVLTGQGQEKLLLMYLKKIGTEMETETTKLMDTLSKIQEQADQHHNKTHRQQDMHSLLAKLEKCRNPLFNTQSTSFKKRKATVEAEIEETRRKKREEWKKEQEATMAAFMGES